jgi:hypothetical protein
MITEVIQVVEYAKHTNGFSVIVKAVTPNGNEFTYQFIKNLKEDADKIVKGFKWEYNSKRKWV